MQLAISAVGAELVAGQTLLRWRDTEAPYLNGQIGLGNGPGCHTRFERVAVRGHETI